MRAPWRGYSADCISDMHELGYPFVGTGSGIGDWTPDSSLTNTKHDFRRSGCETLPKNDRTMINQHSLVMTSALENLSTW